MVSATAAPVVLVGGWTWAAARQPAGYDPVRDTISALAARGATDRWIMTTALAVLGACHVVTATGLTGSRPAGRATLALGGLATMLVSALPQPNAGHVPAATVGFLALAVWPWFSQVPSRRAARAASAVLLALLAWLATTLVGGHLLGVSERALAGAQAVWPLMAALTIRAASRGSRSSRAPSAGRTPP